MEYNKLNYLILFILVFSSLSVSAFANSKEPVTLGNAPEFDNILINSRDWEDVYSGMVAGRLVSKDFLFLTSGDSALSVPSRMFNEGNTLLLESRDKKVFVGFSGYLKQEGYSPAIYDYDESINLQLTRDLDVDSFILMDSAYPYHAISVAPYAIFTNSFVVFIDGRNAREVRTILESKAKRVMVVGYLPREVSDIISSLNPEILVEGDKYEVNIEMAKKFNALSGAKQVSLTTGDFLQEVLINDFNAAVFLGFNNVPESTEKYLGESDIKSMVLVGNIIPLGERVKERLASQYNKKVGVQALLGQTYGEEGGSYKSLDYFFLPIILPEISVEGYNYNQLTKNLEVTYRNPGELTTFFKSTISLLDSDEEITVGDEDAEVIYTEKTKTLIYPINLETRNVRGSILTIYGESPNSLELTITTAVETIPFISINDLSSINITSVKYDKINKAFYINVKNTGKVKVYVNLELLDIIVDGLLEDLASPKLVSLEVGESIDIKVRARLSDLDIEENDPVHVKAYYGQRDSAMFKILEDDFPLFLRKTEYIKYGAIITLVVLIIFFLFFFSKKKRYICDKCQKVSHSRKKPRRCSCGGKYHRG